MSIKSEWRKAKVAPSRIDLECEDILDTQISLAPIKKQNGPKRNNKLVDDTIKSFQPFIPYQLEEALLSRIKARLVNISLYLCLTANLSRFQ